MWLALFTLSVRRGVFWSRCFPHHLLCASISSEEAPRCSSSSRGDVCSHPCCQTMFIPFFLFTFPTKYVYLRAGALNKRAVLWCEPTDLLGCCLPDRSVHVLRCSFINVAERQRRNNNANNNGIGGFFPASPVVFSQLEVHIIELNWAATISQNESVLVPVYCKP